MQIPGTNFHLQFDKIALNAGEPVYLPYEEVNPVEREESEKLSEKDYAIKIVTWDLFASLGDRYRIKVRSSARTNPALFLEITGSTDSASLFSTTIDLPSFAAAFIDLKGGETPLVFSENQTVVALFSEVFSSQGIIFPVPLYKCVISINTLTATQPSTPIQNRSQSQ